MKLNLGCGTRLKKGYINIDIRETKPSVVKSDVTKLPYSKNSIDEIYAIDVYEHIGFLKSKSLLNHWVSLLKPGGKLIIQTTNILGLFELMNRQKNIEGIEAAIRKIFGGQDYKFNHHNTAGHPVLLKQYLKQAGIRGSINIKCKGTNMTVEAIK